MKFEWDPNKEKINVQKHGITFEQASYVFADPYALSKFDENHSGEEDRWLLLGKSLNEVLLVVVHAFKDRDDGGEELVRIISARKATANESAQYHLRCPR